MMLDDIMESKAPWNNDRNKPMEIEVLVSVTMSRPVKIMVDDYTIEEDGYDFSTCDLKSAVTEQVILPKTDVVDSSECCVDKWEIDEFEVVLN